VEFTFSNEEDIGYARIPSKPVDKMENICKNTVKGEHA